MMMRILVTTVCSFAAGAFAQHSTPPHLRSGGPMDPIALRNLQAITCDQLEPLASSFFANDGKLPDAYGCDCSTAFTTCSAFYKENCFQASCSLYNCGNRTNAPATIEVCTVETLRLVFDIDNFGGYASTSVRSEIFYTKGVSNVQNLVTSGNYDKATANLASCTFEANGAVCNSCDICPATGTSDSDLFAAVDCTNVLGGSIPEVCGTSDNPKEVDILVLNEGVVRPYTGPTSTAAKLSGLSISVLVICALVASSVGVMAVN